MENSFQTSFIPKKPITSEATTKTPMSLFSILSIFVLIIMGSAAGGLYFYKNYLINQEEVLSASLKRASGNFEKDTLTELSLFDKRVSASKELISGHVVLSPMFDLLGSLTIPNIQYTKFTHDTTDLGFVVNISGVAVDYKSIALQADVFNSEKGRQFKDVVFSNLNKEKNGNVDFDLNFTVDPSLLSYEKNILINSSASSSPATMSNPVVNPVSNTTDNTPSPVATPEVPTTNTANTNTPSVPATTPTVNNAAPSSTNTPKP